MLKKWNDLPEFMRVPEVRPYWEALNQKRAQLAAKRLLDVMGSAVLTIALGIPMIVIAVWIKLDSPGPALYRQERVTAYGKHFKIHKFRTMVSDAEQIGSAVTVENDSRITHVGSKLRRLRLDEFPQLFDVLEGTMSFVGTRPEAVKFVDQYQPEYLATLLMPAGITSEASIRFKDEYEMLSSDEDVDRSYVERVLPQKMAWNLKMIKRFSLTNDILIVFKTIFAVIK